MKKFVKNIVFFILPVILVFAGFVSPFYLVAEYTGEFKTVDEWISIQEENLGTLVGMGYNEQTKVYKLINCNKKKSNVIALGTSRVMQFKEFFFNDSFYNCGGAVSTNYNEYLNFLQNLEHKPEIIILGLDAWVFNDAWNGTSWDKYVFTEITEINRDKKSICKQMFQDWCDKKWSFEAISNNSENLGFNGRIRNEGFMQDGSYYYGYIYADPQNSTDYQFVDTYLRIETGTRRFEWGTQIDTSTLVQLDNLLNYCSENNIQVIGFLAPFAPSVFDKMVESGNYDYLKEIPDSCNKIFENYGFEFYDFLDGEKLNNDDSCFVDGFHGSEIVYAYILVQMYDENSIIREKIDIYNIKELLSNRYSGLVFYNPEVQR